MKRCFIMAAMLMALICGCSVKEDRTQCPCRLSLDFGQIDTSVVRSLCLLATLGDEVVFRDVIDAQDIGREYVRDVPHGNLRVNVWSVDADKVESRQGVVIPYGCECPLIYMNSFAADTRGEECCESVSMYKNHCKLTVKVEGCDEMPYSLTFKGNVDGYSLDGLPSGGDFLCVAYPGDAGESEAVLPRQVDSSLLMEVDDGTSIAKTFAVGEYISSCGYDWGADNLEDVTVILDYHLTYMSISIREWDKEYVYDITL